jgi:hypothetical protein
MDDDELMDFFVASSDDEREERGYHSDYSDFNDLDDSSESEESEEEDDYLDDTSPRLSPRLTKAECQLQVKNSRCTGTSLDDLCKNGSTGTSLLILLFYYL